MATRPGWGEAGAAARAKSSAEGQGRGRGVWVCSRRQRGCSAWSPMFFAPASRRFPGRTAPPAPFGPVGLVTSAGRCVVGTVASVTAGPEYLLPVQDCPERFSLLRLRPWPRQHPESPGAPPWGRELTRAAPAPETLGASPPQRSWSPLHAAGSCSRARCERSARPLSTSWSWGNLHSGEGRGRSVKPAGVPLSTGPCATAQAQVARPQTRT